MPPQQQQQRGRYQQLPFRGFVLGIALAACVMVLHSVAVSTTDGAPRPVVVATTSTAVLSELMATQAADVAADDTPAPTTFAPRPTKPRTPVATMPWIPQLVTPERQARFFPEYTYNASVDAMYIPAMVNSPDDDGVVAEAAKRADALLLRAMDESNTKLTPAMREKLKRTALEQRRKAEDTLLVLEGVPFNRPTGLDHGVHGVVKPPVVSSSSAESEPSPKKAAAADKDDVCYFILTGNNSHATRVQGLFAVLAQSGKRRHRIAWISDVPDELIKPVVLRSAFEDGVCRDGLAEETQMKGCRYQRNFYRALDAIQVVADAVVGRPNTDSTNSNNNNNGNDEDNNGANETSRETIHRDFAGCNWFVKLSDDTVLVREHLEWLLRHSAVDPAADRAIIGKVERRNGYQFLSGGHPVVFTRAALERWGAVDARNCEGLIIDKGPPKLQKFWWWADDVLTSFCWGHPESPYQLYDLPGAISVTRWALAPIPPRAFVRIVPLPRVNTSAHAAAAPAHGCAAVLPVSYHTYPYATPRQMFSLWHWLHR